MKLTRITAENLKGSSFTYQLAPEQAIIGDNFTGKTAILEAIRLCLMGYLPEVGKLPKSTWELSSAARMTVRLNFDDKSELTREFWLEGGTVKTTAHSVCKVGVPVQLESLPLLHAERYFGMTDSERTNYVFGMIKLPDSYTKEAIISEVERLSLEEEHSEQVEKAKGEQIETLRKCFDAEVTVQGALGRAVEAFKANFTQWNRRAKDTMGAVKTLTELKLREKTVVAAAQGVEQAIKKAGGELEELNQQKGRLIAQEEEAQRTATRRTVVERLLGVEVQDYAGAIEKLRKRTVALLPELDQKERAALVSDIRRAKEHRAEVAGKVSEQERLLTRTAEEEKQLSKMTSCPYCHSKGENWRETLAKELDATLKKAAAASNEARKLLAGLDTAIERMETVISQDDESVRKNGRLRLETETTANQIKALERDKASDEARRRELQGELAELQKRPAAKDLSADIGTVQGKVTSKRGELAEANAAKEAETKLQQELRLASQAQLEHLNAAAHVTVIKAIGKLLAARREAMIEEVFTSLLVVANKVAGGILKAPLALHDNTVGMWSGAKFIPHRVFSGTEKALAYIAIAVALSAQAPLKLVILDEFGRLDEENQYKVLLRLSICVLEGIIDQFIVVGTSLPPQEKSSNIHLEVIHTK